MEDLAHLRYRMADRRDEELLRTATLLNLNWPGPRFSAEEIVLAPALARYARLQPERGDLGVVVAGPEGPVGVSWLLFLPAADPGYGFVAEGVPELCICVLPAWRGRGIGRDLLDRVIIAAAARGVDRISLSVEADNPARRLYERSGFRSAALSSSPGTMVLDVTDAPALRA